MKVRWSVVVGRSGMFRYDTHKEKSRLDGISLEQHIIAASVKRNLLWRHEVIGNDPPLMSEANKFREGKGANIHG